jgi:hypothetical protein
MILSVHQPNFIPWIGYFNKIAKSDLFVILDSVQYPRGNSIKQGRNKIELVVPIKKANSPDGKIPYNETNFAEKSWNRKILKAIKLSYGNAPFFDLYFERINEIFSKENFCEMNIEFLYFILDEFSITTKVVLLSEINSNFGKKNDLIIDICKHFNATTYLSGEGAKKYNLSELYLENKINLEYNSFIINEYPQLGKGPFIPNLSILDLLFNEGRNGRGIVL